jgi:hypothetical protein
MKRTMQLWLLAASSSVLLSCAMSWTAGDGGEIDADVPSEGDNGCGPGLTNCGGLCVDTSSDHSHCGQCDHACGPSQACDAGECVDDCPPGKTKCYGACVDTESDVRNCGSCGNACSAGVNADPVCNAGTCGVRCHPGWSDPDGDGNCDIHCEPSSPVEICNGIDDDCNGEIDEDFECSMGVEVNCSTVCGSTGRGICGVDCRIPDPAACNPPEETCNGIDDNCSGECDDGDGMACCSGETGTCTTSCGSEGTRTCLSTCVWDTCQIPEETCNGIDDDCDGVCDNGFDCCRGSTDSCTTSCGSTGTGVCSESCTIELCAPPAESCGNLSDDDCDWSVDELGSCMTSLIFEDSDPTAGETINVTTRFPGGVVCVELEYSGPCGTFYADYIRVPETGPPRWSWLWEAYLPSGGRYHFRFKHQNYCSESCDCPYETAVEANLEIEGSEACP